MIRILVILVCTACTCSVYAQTTIRWKGGTPGREDSWNEPRNWDAQRLPDAFDKVIIRLDNTGHFAQPVLDSEVTVAWIDIQSGGLLTITEHGRLNVDGRYTYSEGITMNKGHLISNGDVVLIGIEPDESALAFEAPLTHGTVNTKFASGEIWK